MRITGIVLLVIVLVVAGYFVFRPHAVVAPESAISPSVSPSPSHTITPKPSGTSSPSPTLIPTVAPKPTAAPTNTPVVSHMPTPGPIPTQTQTPTPVPSPQTYTVNLSGQQFDPSALTVNKGDIIVFTAVDAFYSVVVDGRSSGRMQPGQQWSLDSGDFAPGTYQMSDAMHGYMHGTLTVQ